MRFTLSFVFVFTICALLNGQASEWYSESLSNGIRIQNSFPKGGPYTGPTTAHFNYSYLVFFTRINNEREEPIEVVVNFSADSIPIPNSPDTYVKLFLPPDTMTMDKRGLFSYGVTELESFGQSTRFYRKVNPKEDCLFYFVAIFYQTKAGEWQSRGGNRAELILNGQDLFYRLRPQIDEMRCGEIIFNR